MAALTQLYKNLLIDGVLEFMGGRMTGQHYNRVGERKHLLRSDAGAFGTRGKTENRETIRSQLQVSAMLTGLEGTLWAL